MTQKQGKFNDKMLPENELPGILVQKTGAFTMRGDNSRSSMDLKQLGEYAHLSSKKFTPVPIVALTAHALDHIKQECFAAGMDGHLSKPFDAAQLDKVLQRFSSVRLT